MDKEHVILLGDLVYYIGPPILNPLIWENIVENDNGIISRNDLAIVIEIDSFLRIADLFFQRQELKIERIAFKHIKCISWFKPTKSGLFLFLFSIYSIAINHLAEDPLY